MGPLYFFTWRYKSDIDFLSVFKKLKFECFIEIFESIFKKIDSNYIKKWCKVFKFRRFRALQKLSKWTYVAFKIHVHPKQITLKVEKLYLLLFEVYNYYYYLCYFIFHNISKNEKYNTIWKYSINFKLFTVYKWIMCIHKNLIFFICFLLKRTIIVDLTS